ncbi:sarcosine oxidase [Skermanella aerolata]|uniref:Sarcosine oxidase n=1 Tax=Skermanella aerolata TaxID=393310 RepID=A0A512DJS2_9PROT|nr:N-methyl-L-tryptophan oxidase [Skermanella aerolata]GEO36440.1 sarcosine oxidase [Skermanella aerolata]
MAGQIETADLVVVGLGAMGAATLYQAARLGVKAIGIDRFTPPHDKGSSHGETRITRCAIGEGEDYVPLALGSHAIWRELENETGESLLVQSGCLILGSSDDTALHHGKPNFVNRTVDSARRFGIPHEILDATGIGQRFPQIAGLRDEIGCFEPGGGFLYPERCIQAQLDRAKALGARIRTGRTVTSLSQSGGSVTVETDAGTIQADRAVCAAGSWTAQLLGGEFRRLLRVNRQVLHWFEADETMLSPGRFPVVIWMHGPKASDYFYGFPALPGSGSIKVATEQYEESADPDRVDRTVAAAEQISMFRDHLAGRLGGVKPRPVGSAVCLYTVTPDSGFIVDHDPARDRIMVVSACSGHGFKHSAAIGKAVAQHVVLGRSDIDLAPFSLARFAC